MFKRLAIGVVCLGCVATLYGAAVKIRVFVPTTGSEEEALGADGMAVFNFVAGQNTTEAQITLTEFQPNTTYNVWVAGNPASAPGSLTTNASGNGHLHMSGLIGDLTTSPITVYVGFDGDDADGFDPTSPGNNDDVRAIGTYTP